MNKEKLIQAVRYYEGDVSGNDPLLSDTNAAQKKMKTNANTILNYINSLQ